MVSKSSVAKQVNINISESAGVAKSANLVRVTSTSNEEVILDFVFLHPEDIKDNAQMGYLTSRVVLPKKVASDFSKVLLENLSKKKN